MANKLSTIDRNKIKTMQKDIISARIKKVEVKPNIKKPEQIQNTEQVSPSTLEKKTDFTPPVVPKIPEIKPIQKTETTETQKPIQPQPQRPTPPEIRPIIAGRIEQKSEEINNIKTKEQDEYREKIEE